MAIPVGSPGEGYYGAGGKIFMSSALADASFRQAQQAGGYTIYTPPPKSEPVKPALSADIRAAFQRAMQMYQPGGGFGAGVESALERGRTKTLAAGGQALVSAGLAGTTMMAGLGKKFEEEVAMPTRMGVEEERAKRLSDLELALAEASQRGYESAAERTLRGQLAGGELGLGYSRLGLEQQRMSMESIQAREREKLALTALGGQTRGDYPPWNRALSPSFSLSPQGYIGSTFDRLGSYYSQPESSYYEEPEEIEEPIYRGFRGYGYTGSW